MSGLRFTILTAGSASGGRVLVIPSASASFAELLEKAHAKLGGDKPFTRCFLDSGAEVEDVAELRDGDRLAFSSGAEFSGAAAQPASDESKGAAPAAAAAAAAAAGGNDAERQAFVSSVVASATEIATSLYERSSTFVKGKSPAIVRVSLENFETAAGPVASSLTSKALAASGWVDGRIGAAVTQLETKRDAFVASEFGQKVNSSFVLPVRERVVDPATSFYQSAVATLAEMESTRRGNAAAAASDAEKKSAAAVAAAAADNNNEADGKGEEAFVARLRRRLGEQWHERLAGPAKTFFAAAQKNKAAGVAQLEALGASWKDKVSRSFDERVVQPAESFYRAGLESYVSLDAAAAGEYDEDGNGVVQLDANNNNNNNEGRVALSDFLAVMRARLGKAWSEKLVDPAKHLFSQVRVEFTRQDKQRRLKPRDPRSPAKKTD